MPTNARANEGRGGQENGSESKSKLHNGTRDLGDENVGAKSGCFTVELGDKFWTRRYLYIPNNGRESGAFGLA